MVDDHKTNDLCDSQPTKGNIEGGLTTIEEKALGNIQKIGRKAPVVGCLDQSRIPDRTRSVVHGFLLSGRGNGHLVRGFRFCGPLFPTGQGNIIGNPILPVIKLSANPALCGP